MDEVVIVSAVRTPIGRIRGALSDVRADDMAGMVIREALARAGVDGGAVEEVYMGCANQAGEDNRNVARMGLLLAGLPHHVAGVTVNRLCASGLNAVNQAARAILAGEGDIFVAGGVENMTRAPYSLPKNPVGFGPSGNVTVLRHLPGLALSQPGHGGHLPPGGNGRDRREHLRHEPGRADQRRRNQPGRAGRLRPGKPTPGGRGHEPGPFRPGTHARLHPPAPGRPGCGGRRRTSPLHQNIRWLPT